MVKLLVVQIMKVYVKLKMHTQGGQLQYFSLKAKLTKFKRFLKCSNENVSPNCYACDRKVLLSRYDEK